jgi:hypothetical protein
MTKNKEYCMKINQYYTENEFDIISESLKKEYKEKKITKEFKNVKKKPNKKRPI